MAHIGRSTSDNHLFWFNDQIGDWILTSIWNSLNKSIMDDDQLLIHKDEEDKGQDCMVKSQLLQQLLNNDKTTIVMEICF